MRIERWVFSVAAAAILAGCGGKPEKSVEPEVSVVEPIVEAPPAGRLPEDVTPTAYRLDLVVDPKRDDFEGAVEIDVTLHTPREQIWLHALGPKVRTALARLPDGTEIPARFEGGLAEGGVSRLVFETDVPAGEATLMMTYGAPYNFGLAGLYKASQAGAPYLATQNEPIDARRMVPSFDEPRFKTPWTLTVTAPAGDEVIANAPLVRMQREENGMARREFATTRPIQTYLLALAVGPYDEVIAAPLPGDALRERAVPLRAFAPAGKSDKTATALAATYDMVSWQEAYFGYPFPYQKLDLIAVPDFAYGAMENAGAIIYREAALLVDDRTSLARKRGVLTTHAHELAHQWFGNLVTPKWWDDIWLNEAFATWMSYKTMHAYDPEGEHDRGAIRRAVAAMRPDSLQSARQIRNPIERNADIFDAFDGITYSKGAGVLTMFETYLGEEAFRDGVRLHMKRFEDGVADAHDFMQSLADGSGDAGVADSFESFIMQPGIPYLDVAVSCPAEDAGLIEISQSRYAPLGSTIDTEASHWAIPLALRISGPAGDRTIRQMMTEKTLSVPLDGDCPDWVMPNAGGSGYWRFDLNEEDWAVLTKNFASLSAAEQLVFMDSLTAAFEAGDASAEAFLAGVEASVYGEWDAAGYPFEALKRYQSILGADEAEALAGWAGDTYASLADYLNSRPATALSQGEILLRDSLSNFLVDIGADEEARHRYVVSARAYVGLDGAPDKSALSPSELGEAVKLAAETVGADFIGRAFTYAQNSQDQSERSAIFDALALGADAESLESLMQTALVSELISGREAYRIFRSGVANPRAQDTGWAFLKRNLKAVVARAPAIRVPQIAGITGSFCSARKAEEAETFFTENADLIPGYERSLAQGVEAAKLCGALKEAKASELAAALGVGEEE